MTGGQLSNIRQKFAQTQKKFSSCSAESFVATERFIRKNIFANEVRKKGFLVTRVNVFLFNK